MAFYLFSQQFVIEFELYSYIFRMTKGAEVPLFDHQDLQRDFTFVSDIVDGILAGL